MAYVATAAPGRRADIWFDGPVRQRRWTVLIRLILLIPQAVVLLIIGIAYLVVLIIGWFAALITGRLPEWAHRFLTGVVRWQTRVTSYFYLLTDRYPPFSLEDEDYPVRPVLPHNGKLNRWSVLFRIILVIPAAFYSTFVQYGLVAPLLVVTWLIALFTGQLPPALYWAYAALQRYLMRVQAFLAMLTSEYAWGMLGDREPDPYGYALPTPPFWPGDAVPPAPAAPTASPQTAPSATPPSEGAPSEQTTSSGQPGTTPMPEPPAENLGQAGEPGNPPSVAASPTPPPPSAYWPPPSPPPTAGSGMPPPPPRDTTRDRGWLVLPRAARNWLIFAIVWGAILFVAQTTINSIVASNNLNRIESQYNTVVNDFNNQKSAVDHAILVSQHCTTIACLRPSHLAAAGSLRRFASDVKAMNLPSGARGPAQLVESDASQLASAFDQLANSSNAQAYRSTVQSSQINPLIRTLPNDTNSLLSALNHALQCPASNGLTFCSS
jgi:hypothetical protein